MSSKEDFFFCSPPEKLKNKRKAKEISENPDPNMNEILGDLFHQRKKLKEKGLQNEEEVEKTKIVLNKPEKEHPMPTAAGKIVSSDKNQTPENGRKPILWINRLRYYPEQLLMPHMLSFRQILFEGLLKKDPDEPRTLQTAFLTTFGYNIELIEPLVTTGVKVVLANEWSLNTEPRIEKNLHGFENLTLIRPPKYQLMNFQGAFHPKLWILKFPKFLRVVVSTGNLTAGDWIIWSNGMWFRDFPKKSTMKSIPEKKLVPPEEFNFDEDFAITLKAYLQAIMPIKINYTQLLGFDLDDYYVSDIDIVLIPSLPGRFKDQDFDKYGHRRIGAVINKLIPKPAKGEKSKKWTVTYQSSSLGSLSEKYVKEFLASVLPHYITLEQLKTEQRMKVGIVPSGDMLFKRLRVIYPTKEYVENSLEGPQYSGCLLLSSENYKKDAFPKFVFHQFQGQDDYIFHEGIIAHMKIFLVTDENGEIDDDSYIYFGSHNLSPSAWGKYEKEYTQFTLNHSELGVLIPPGKGSKGKKMELVKNLPFKFPPVKYNKDQVPWMADLHFKTQQTS